MKHYKSYSHFMLACLKWLARITRTSNSFQAERILQKFLLILRTRGKHEAIKFSKDLRSSVFSYLQDKLVSGGSEILPQSKVLPKELKFLRRINSLGGYPLIRLTLSALYASRALVLPVIPNVETIEGAPLSEVPDSMGLYVSDFWKALGYRPSKSVPSKARWNRFHLSTKQGPNGHALWYSVADLFALPDQLFEDICLLGGKDLESRMRTLKRSPYRFLLSCVIPTRGKRIRKVSSIPSQEGKTREVAILDYWSQTALYGLHQFLFGVLRKIPQDCTFNQGSFKDKLEAPSVGEKYWSVDMTAATDRMPIKLIEIVLRGRLPSWYVNCWHNIMVGYPFWFQGRELYYAVGNPMGAYSSWNSFALTHHYVVYYCCRVLKKDWATSKYCILGDDIVFSDDLLAKKYLEVVGSLGVTFSEKKSHVSPIMFEFAKRTFHNGKEITPFPIGGLWSPKLSMSNIVNVVDSEFLHKAWDVSLSTPEAVLELYRSLGKPSRVIKKLSLGVYTIFHLMEALSGRKLAWESVKALAVAFHPKLSVISDDRWPSFGETMIRETIRTAYSRSAAFDKVIKGLGTIVPRIQELIISEDTFYDASGLRFAVPHVEVYTFMRDKVREEYLNMGSLLSLVQGDWKSSLRAFTIPLSDKLFVQRNQDIRVHAASTLGKILHKLLQDQYDNELDIRYPDPDDGLESFDLGHDYDPGLPPPPIVEPVKSTTLSSILKDAVDWLRRN